MTKIAGYVRVSTEDQADRGSPEVQVAEIKRYAEFHRLELTELYSDEGVSGTIPFAQRPQGARLLADARAKKINAVVFYALDRVGRTVRIILEAMDAFTSLGLDVHCVKDRLDTSTAGGKIAYHVLMVLAEIERDTLLSRTYAGRQRIVRAGRWPGGPAPYGFAIVDGHLAPSAEADIVRDLYTRIAAGSTLVKESQRLNAAGVLSQQGKRWTPGNLGKLIASAVYRGEHTFRSREGAITTAVPALVSAELWQQAREQLNLNSTRPATKRFNLLRAKVHCANCGGTYVASMHTSRKQTYYRCGRSLRLRGERCASINLNAPNLEAYVWQECLEILRHPEMLYQLADNTREHLEAIDATRSREVSRIQAALTEQHAAEQRLVELVGRGIIKPEATDKPAQAINAEIGRLEGELRALATTRNLAGAYWKRVQAAVATVKELAAKTDVSSEGDRRQAVEVLLSSITVKTIGAGRDRRAELTFDWLGQEAYSPTDVRDIEDPEARGIAVGRLWQVLNVATTGDEPRTPTTPVCCTSFWSPSGCSAPTMPPRCGRTRPGVTAP